MVCGPCSALCSAPLSRERDKTLPDFDRVFEWTASHGFETTLIGGLAVGVFSPTYDVPVLSGDLDLLASPSEQQRISRAAARDPDVQILKAIQPRALPVLVLGWDQLEVDVLSQSDGLPDPAAAIQRAWDVDGVAVADPADLLRIKLAMKREKDLDHIKILRKACEGFSRADLETQSGRGAFHSLRRWVESEGWESIPKPVFDRLIAVAVRTSAEGRRYLVLHAPARPEAKAVCSVAPGPEQKTLSAIVKHRFQR